MIGELPQPARFQLSIAIPTYNRCASLRTVLESIAQQAPFRAGRVQLCISDNASSDATDSVIREFRLRYPTQTKAIRQERNIGDENFPAVLAIADAKYIKLNNDTLCHADGSLAYLLDEIDASSPSDVLLFNGTEAWECDSVDDVARRLSYATTWIGGFGIWQEDKAKVLARTGSSRNLWQTEVTYFLCATKKHTKVRQTFKVHSLNAGPKGPYAFNEVFINQYLTILSDLVRNGEIQGATYRYLRRDVLLRFCTTWAALSLLRLNSRFPVRSHFRYLIDWYWSAPHLLIAYPLLICIKVLRYKWRAS